MDNPDLVILPEKPNHSVLGMLSFALPSLVFCLVVSQLTALMGTRGGALFLYVISPIILLTSAILACIELLRNKAKSKLFPFLGIIVALIAAAPMILLWLLGLMQGIPFSCLETPSFCGW